MDDSLTKDILVSVVIPSLDGSRNGNVERLKKSLEHQTWKNIETIVVVGVSPNSRARNEGVAKSKGKILVFIDDDVELAGNCVIANIIKPICNDTTIGLAGPYQLVPPDANPFQIRFAKEVTPLPEVADVLIDSDRVSHMCMAITRKLFDEIGGENEEIFSGTDPEFRARIRQAGYRICLVPETFAFHPPPENWREFVRQTFRNGACSARTSLECPHLVYEIAPEGEMELKTPQRPLVYRLIRFVFKTLKALLLLRFISLVQRIIYVAGYAYTYLIKLLSPGKYRKIIR